MRLSSIRFKSSSKQYLLKTQNDQFIAKKKSSQEFFKSRAAYKLIEIDTKFNIFTNSTRNIVDLGFAPGAWSQVAIQRLTDNGVEFNLLGVDINRANALKNCHFLQGDVMKKSTHEKISQFFYNEPIDLVMSDMMVNTQGQELYDHLGNIELNSAGLLLCFNQLKQGGKFVCKVWSGPELDKFHKQMSLVFSKVHRYKPEASRSESRELYFIGENKKRNLNISLQELFL